MTAGDEDLPGAGERLAALELAVANLIGNTIGGVSPPYLRVALLAKVRDAWRRLAADIPVYGIDITSMFLPDQAGGANPAPVLVVVARGVALVDDAGLLSWQAMPGWTPSQQVIDHLVAKVARSLREARAAALKTIAPGLNGRRS